MFRLWLLRLSTSMVLPALSGCGYVDDVVTGAKAIDYFFVKRPNEEKREEELQEEKLKTEETQREQNVKNEETNRNILIAQHQQREADERERNRDRSFPAIQLDPTADQIARIIAEKLPRHPYVASFIEETSAQMVLFKDLADNSQAPRSPGAAENLLSKVMIRLKANPTISDYFMIAMDRKSAKAMLHRSEGKSDEIIIHDQEEVARYTSDMIIGICLNLVEQDHPGRTTWNVHFEAATPETREILLKEEIPVP